MVDEVTDRLRLESQIVGERWMRLKEATIRVQNHKDAYRRECSQLGEQKKTLEEQRKEFELEVSSSTAATLTEDEQMIRVVLNIGGRRFESTAEVLTKDRFSVLAALCTATPPVDPETNGTYFFDRDGELFQHCINFLRDNVLPEDQASLRGLYTEASFFRLGSLRRAVERKFDQILVDAERVARNRGMMTMQTRNQNMMTMNSMMATSNGVMGATMANNATGKPLASASAKAATAINNKNTSGTERGMNNNTSMAAAQAGGAGVGTYLNMGGMPGGGMNGSMMNGGMMNGGMMNGGMMNGGMMNGGMMNGGMMGRNNLGAQRMQTSALPDPFGFTTSNSMVPQRRQAGMMGNMMGAGAMGGMMANTMGNTMSSTRGMVRDDFGI